MTWKLRKATIDDKDKIEKLFIEMLQSVYNTKDVKGYDPDYLNKFFENKGDWICVAEADKRIVGYLSIEEHADYLYLDDYCVGKEYRGLGIGSALLKEAENYAIKRKIPQVRLHVEKSNSNATRLYQRTAYNIIGEKGSRYLMAKTISFEKLPKTANKNPLFLSPEKRSRS